MALLLCAGCGMRENAKAAKQTDQAVAGAATLVSAAASAETDEARRQFLQAALDLLAQARRSLEPVLARLRVGEDAPLVVSTKAPESIEDVPAFIAAAQEQVGRARAEVEDAEMWQGLWEGAKSYLIEVASSGLASSLVAGGGLSGALAAILALWRQASRWKTAAQAAVAHGDRMEDVDPNDGAAVEKAIETSIKEQKTAGVQKLIAQLRHKPPRDEPRPRRKPS